MSASETEVSVGCSSSGDLPTLTSSWTTDNAHYVRSSIRSDLVRPPGRATDIEKPRSPTLADVDDVQNLRVRVEIVAAYLLAVEDRARLLEICSSVTGDIAMATRALSEAYGISDYASTAILDMQIRRFTPENVAVIRDEHAELLQR